MYCDGSCKGNAVPPGLAEAAQMRDTVNFFRDLYAKVEAKHGRGQISSACMITEDIGFSAVGSDLSLNYV